MLYRTLDKMGLVSLKKTLVNTSAIVGVVVVIYAISWMWKHLIKPTYYNFKSEPKPKPETPETKIIEIVREKEPIQIIEPAKINKAQPQPTIESKPAVEVVKAEPKTDKVETTIEPTGQEAEVEPKQKTDETKNTENLDQPTKTKKPKKTKKRKETNN